jgi:hypothetical protein
MRAVNLKNRQSYLAMNLNVLLPLRSQLQAEATKFSTKDRTCSSSREEISSPFKGAQEKPKKEKF